MFKGQSAQKIDWKQTEGQMGLTGERTDCFIFPANAVVIKAISSLIAVIV